MWKWSDSSTANHHVNTCVRNENQANTDLFIQRSVHNEAHDPTWWIGFITVICFYCDTAINKKHKPIAAGYINLELKKKLWELVTSYVIVSARLVEAENFDWRLFRVSGHRLIKWFGVFARTLIFCCDWTKPRWSICNLLGSTLDILRTDYKIKTINCYLQIVLIP